MTQAWKERILKDDAAKREIVALLEARERAFEASLGRKPQKLPNASDLLELLAHCCAVDVAVWGMERGDLAKEFRAHAVELLNAVRSESAEDTRAGLLKIRNSKFDTYAECARILLECIDGAEKEAEDAAADVMTQEFPAASKLLAPTNRIRFRCPLCSRGINAPLSAAGKQASCPGCSQILTVPFSAGVLSGKIAVTCSCGKRIVAGASMAGKRFKCPECGDVNHVPAPAG